MLEELPAQRVLARGVPRLGLSGAIVVAVMVGLLAAGFGVLGGRPSPSPQPTLGAAATVSEAAPTPGLGGGETPEVTPWVECGPPPAAVAAPEVLFEANGRTFPGAVEIPSGGNGGWQPIESSTPARIDVAIDEITELWIGGASCALAWTIDGPDGNVIASVVNAEHNPAHAAQNRFAVLLAPFEGKEFDLRALFVFPSLTARWTWRIHVMLFPRPTGILRSSASETAAVEGCGVVLTLGNGWESRGAECDGLMKEQPRGSLRVAPGESLEFGFDGWFAGVDVTCGRLSGPGFAEDPGARCPTGTHPGDRVSFVAPRTKGRWTLSMSGCALRTGTVSSTSMCGTWYANVEVR